MCYSLIRLMSGIYKPFQLAYHVCVLSLSQVSEEDSHQPWWGPHNFTCLHAVDQRLGTYGACHFSIKESVPGDVFSSDHSHIKFQVYSIYYCDMIVISSESSSVNNQYHHHG
jgi:hypothetical protein